jgi:Protein of unknown function (DUF1648)
LQNLSITPSKLDKAIEWLSRAAALSCVAYFIYAMNVFPENIPVHFNGAGQPDRMGGKSALWLNVAVPLGLWLLLSYLQRRPHRFNYAVPIHEGNQQRQYQLAYRLLGFYKLNIALAALLLFWNVHGICLNVPHPSEGWFALMMLTLVIMPLPIYLFLTYREPKK